MGAITTYKVKKENLTKLMQYIKKTAKNKKKDVIISK